MNDYVSDSMAWSFVGLVIGYALGKTEVTVHSLYRRYLRQHFHPRSPREHT